MSSKRYWAKRKLARMDEYHKDSDRVIGKVLEAYQGSIYDINEQISSILKTFTTANKMTLDEAKQYLTIPESKDFIENLKQTIDRVIDEDLKAEMLRQINTPAYRARLTRLQAMKEKLNIECKKLADIQVREIEKGLINTAHTAYYKTIFDIQQLTGIGFSFAGIPTKQIEEILKNNWSGKHFSKRIWQNTNMLASELEHTLTKGFMIGASVQRMSKDIADKMQVGEYVATRLIRTETTYVANMAELEAYKEAGVEKIMFLATLDLRTSDKCMKHDKEIITLSKAMPGKNIPPLHANCRSTTIEIFEDDNLAELERRSRDPVTGKNKTVPANTNYKDWYKENVENNPRALAKEKKIKNRISDKKQYEKFKEVLGNDLPKSFDKFQELKYNNSEKWDFVKLDYQRRKQLLDDPSLILPNADNVFVANEKFKGYLYNEANKKGYAKGKLFKDRLGYSATNYEMLKNEIIKRAPQYPAIAKLTDEHGTRYEQKIIIYGLNNKPANVIVAWNVKDGVTKMTSTYIKEVK